MLTQLDIDNLMQSIQSNEDTYIYYVAHMIEGREVNSLDEHTYKDISDFKVVKVKIENIENAYFEYLNYIKNPDNYHNEEEVEYYYNPRSEYINTFVVPNGTDSYDKDINARMPAIIYGYKRKIIIDNGNNNDGIDVETPTPVKEIYTNVLEFGSMNSGQIEDAMKSKKLDWKYMELKDPAIVDGIEYKYITSDWYILTLSNYPMVEKPLINVKQHSGYFVDINDAFNYIEQLKA